MPHLSGHEYLTIVSFFAAIAGVFLSLGDKEVDSKDPEGTYHLLLTMSFAYWLVYCVAVGLQKVICQEWEMALTGVKLTGVLSYLLTFSCILSLPLHKVSVRQPE